MFYRALTWVIHTGLDDVVQGEASGGLLVPELGVHFLGEDLGHVVVVLGELGELLLALEVQLKVVVCVSERHDCVSLLQGKRKDSRSEEMVSVYH